MKTDHSLTILCTKSY